MQVDCLVPQRVIFFLDPAGSHELVSASSLDLILSDRLVEIVSRIEDLRGEWTGHRLVLLMKVIGCHCIGPDEGIDSPIPLSLVFNRDLALHGLLDLQLLARGIIVLKNLIEHLVKHGSSTRARGGLLDLISSAVRSEGLLAAFVEVAADRAGASTLGMMEGPSGSDGFCHHQIQVGCAIRMIVMRSTRCGNVLGSHSDSCFNPGLGVGRH